MDTAAGFGDYPAFTEMWGELRFRFGSCNNSRSFLRLDNVLLWDTLMGRLREVINLNRLGLVSCVHCLGLSNWSYIGGWDLRVGDRSFDWVF